MGRVNWERGMWQPKRAASLGQRVCQDEVSPFATLKASLLHPGSRAAQRLNSVILWWDWWNFFGEDEQKGTYEHGVY